MSPPLFELPDFFLSFILVFIVFFFPFILLLDIGANLLGFFSILGCFFSCLGEEGADLKTLFNLALGTGDRDAEGISLKRFRTPRDGDLESFFVFRFSVCILGELGLDMRWR